MHFCRNINGLYRISMKLIYGNTNILSCWCFNLIPNNTQACQKKVSSTNFK